MPRPDPTDPDASREALIAAARRMIAAGGAAPGVAEAARAAGVSRASAYRRFSSAEALAEAAAPDPETAPMPDILAGLRDPVARALAVHDAFAALAAGEARRGRDRLARRLAAEGPARRRGARRRAAFRAALAPIRHRLREEDFDDLVHALCALTGAEARAALRDLGALPPEAAARAARRATAALLAQAAAAWTPPRRAMPGRAMPGRAEAADQAPGDLTMRR